VYVLAVIEHGSRRVRVLRATEHPVQSRVVQQARNLLMDLDDAGTRARLVPHDRDASLSAASGAVLQFAGIRVIHTAVQEPHEEGQPVARTAVSPGRGLDRRLARRLFGSFVAALVVILVAGALQVIARELWQATAWQGPRSHVPPPGAGPSADEGRASKPHGSRVKR